MNNKVGLTGWLSPDGVFYPCEYGEHSKKAFEIVKEKKIKDKKAFMNSYFFLQDDKGWIPMASKGIPSSSYIIISNKITDKQNKRNGSRKT